MLEIESNSNPQVSKEPFEQNSEINIYWHIFFNIYSAFIYNRVVSKILNVFIDFSSF